jgi:hypothetical protein
VGATVGAAGVGVAGTAVGVARTIGIAVDVSVMDDVTGDGVAVGDGAADGCGVADGTGDALRTTVGRGDGFAVRVASGCGEFSSLTNGDGVSFAATFAAGGIVAAIVGATATVLSDDVCFPNSESPEPITKPSTTTPINTGKSGNDDPSSCGGGLRERRGGEPCIGLAFSSSPCSGLARRNGRNGRGRETAKLARVIRVSVPIDVGTIAAMASSAFALATPIRVDRLLELAVSQACGARAPQDKRERSIRTTLEGFRAGKFVVDIDGRLFDRPDAVVVCAGCATLRFFSTEPAERESQTA